ncbi:MAG: hypothetical protein DHS20C11_23300 [Lysobacteraceae bacterium]|nr:MAG: hypothetical protein DHS20C11_23300 [Xanthomonadaceae bacterium]
MDKVLYFIESAVLTVLLLTLIALGMAQIVSRDLLESGFEWAEPLQRVVVFWLGLFGAVAAARASRHIRIDLLPRMLHGVKARAIHVVSCLFTCAVSALLCWHAGRLVWFDFQDQTTGVLGWPAWIVGLILPVSFGAIALCYLVASFKRPTQESKA